MAIATALQWIRDSNKKGYTLYRFMFGIKVIEIIHISQSTGYSK